MKGWFLILFGMVASLVSSEGTASENKQVVGWVEKVRISPGNLILNAKVDTGADNSSLNVPDMTEFYRDGEKWVRFRVTDHDGQTAELERKIVRVASIKRNDCPRQKRPVVLLDICIGNFRSEAEVSLVDRSRFKYPVLIGRSFMGNNVLVDPGRTYTLEPQCREASSR